MSIEEVKEHFKNAKEVRCAFSKDIVDITQETERDIYIKDNDFWIDIRNYKYKNILLFDRQRNKFAEIISYKEKEPKFKVGDRVEVVKNYSGHEFKIGEVVDVVEILRIKSEDDGSILRIYYECYSIDSDECWHVEENEIKLHKESHKEQNKYNVNCKGIEIDVYDVLDAYDVINPATQHAVKKLLKGGERGYKDLNQDYNEAISSIKRAIELNEGKTINKMNKYTIEVVYPTGRIETKTIEAEGYNFLDDRFYFFNKERRTILNYPSSMILITNVEYKEEI